MAELILSGGSTTVDLTPFEFERIIGGRMIESQNEYDTGARFGVGSRKMRDFEPPVCNDHNREHRQKCGPGAVEESARLRFL